MKALNIPNNQIPQYGSALIIELYENRTSIADWDVRSFIKLRYLNETLSDGLNFKINPLKIQTLEDKERYTVREFLSSFSHLLMENDEMDEQCRETNKGNDQTQLVFFSIKFHPLQSQTKKVT